METHENFIKQTNRNRFHIYGQGGVQSLFIPLVQHHLNNTLICDVCIAYDTPWQRTCWRTLTGAYNRSAFFEFYKDELELLFFEKCEKLIQFNEKACNWILKCLKIDLNSVCTDAYLKNYGMSITDMRYISNCKTNQPVQKIQFKKYPQVFEDKHGFIKNLSGLDLLFNMGPQASLYL